MFKVSSLDEVNQLLTGFFPPPYSMRESYNLDRMNQLMNHLGNPQNDLKIVHVAGTSGKTSTAYYMAALLTAGGQKVGLTVSPHVENVNERLQINMQPLESGKFCDYFNEYVNLPGVADLKPTYFELLVGFAYWAFATKERVDYAVIEVGLGGLGDSTNVADRQDKVCIITDIGMDHMHVLGDTIPKIAAQKAGIIKQHNRVFTVEQDKDALDVIKQTAAKQQAELTVVEPIQTAVTKELPPFAARDWQLAYAAYQYIAGRDGLPQLIQEEQSKTSHVTVPARMEIFKVGAKTVILDGSHNQQKMAALAAGLRQRFPGQKLAMLTGFVNSRVDRINQAVAEIVPLTDKVIVTAADLNKNKQDLQHQAMDPELVRQACLEAGATDVTVVKDPQRALESLMQCPQPILLVTGSFYLMSLMRPLIRGAVKHD